MVPHARRGLVVAVRRVPRITLDRCLNSGAGRIVRKQSEARRRFGKVGCRFEESVAAGG